MRPLPRRAPALSPVERQLSIHQIVRSKRPEMNYRISGHEGFPCRYTWLPKVAHCLTRDDRLLADEERAMVELGVGKNMVRSIRFWAQSAGITNPQGRDGRLQLTPFAHVLLGDGGFDPFLEDIGTLWLLHWKLSTETRQPLLAWDFLLNRWQEPEIVPSTVLKALQKEAMRHCDKLSLVTLEQHLDTFLHTYVPTRGRKGEVQEDSLDCPLVELALIIKVGEREQETQSNKRQTIYVFRREEKPDISAELFTYCLNDFWQARHLNEATLSFREVAYGHGSPGQIFKLPEEDVRARLETLDRLTGGVFTYSESASLQQIRRHRDQNEADLLTSIYRRGTQYG